MGTTVAPLERGEGAVAADARGNGAPVRVEPDLPFILSLRREAGATFKRCFQCGTCSSTCELSPAEAPFPRKEMAWAAWGLRERLLGDVDVWLCHQCNDCSERCPRGGRPGDVLAAIRRECVVEWSFPRVLARAASRVRSAPLLLAVPAAILAAALSVREPLGEALGLARPMDDRIVYSYSNMLPQWLINVVFGAVTLVVLAVLGVGVKRQWRALRAAVPRGRHPPAKGRLASVLAALRDVFTHDRFRRCTVARSRHLSHVLVFYGFVALTVVTLWVITARVNPLIPDGFVYPFAFLHPFKVLANLGGFAVVVGGTMMALDRVREGRKTDAGTAFDWWLLAMVLAVAATGFLTEVLHYTRYEPHRHAAYFVHLVLVLGLILYLPYSKLAHLAYRTVALAFAERIGRRPDPERAREKGVRS